MSGYTKLFTTILDSTIWREPDHVRILWITMLAMVDKNGYVGASIPGLADRAKITIEQCTEALDRLQQPDEFSRSTNNDGRRIEAADGGWYLINYCKYRDLITLQEKRAQAAARARKYRERQKERDERDASRYERDGRDASRDITPVSVSVSSEKEKNIKKKPAYPSEFLSFWEIYPRKENKRGALRAWQAAKKRDLPAIEELEQIIKKQLKSEQWRNGYIPHAATWLNGNRWEDEQRSEQKMFRIPGVPGGI